MDKQAKDNSRKDGESSPVAGEALAPAGWRRHLPVAGVAALVLTAVMGNVTKIWNDDDPWHLAAGQRMLQNLSIATTDTFAYPYHDSNPQRIWINVHWLFQVAAAGVHAIGGYDLLSIFKGLMGGLVLLIFGLALYRRVPAAWLVLCGLLMIHYISIRLRIRPEMFSFVFLMLTITIVDGVAAGRPAKLLWWLVPIQLVWVNMHALYILGIAIIWSGLIFAMVEKWLGRADGENHSVPAGMAGNLASMNALVAAVAATIACFVSPWPIEGPMQAFVLHKDISGRSEYLTYGISEFLPLWNTWTSFMDVAILAVLVLFVIGLLAALELLKLSRPRIPIRHVVWMAAFIYLAGTARRNVALLGPLLSYLLALHGGQALTMIASARPRLAAIRHWLAVGAIALTVVVAALYIPRPWKWFNIDERSGVGMQEGRYPVETAKFLGSLPAAGVLLCDDFGAASTYIYYGGPRNNPNRLLYMDGRVGLKVHTLDRFIEYIDLYHAMRKVSSAREMKLPDVIRFITVQHDNKEHLSAMSACTDRFRLIFMDPVAVCFARLDWPLGDPLEGIPERSGLARYDMPLEAAGFVRGVPPVRRGFFMPKPFSLNSRLGEIFLAIGNNPDAAGPLKSNPVKQRALLLAARYLTAAAGEGVENCALILASLAQTFGQLDVLMQGAVGQDITAAGTAEGASATSLPVHLDSARALHIYNTLDWSEIDHVQLNGIILQQIRTMLQAGMVDYAQTELKNANKRLSGFWRVNPPQMYVDLDNRIKVLINQNRIEQMRMNLAARPLLDRAAILASPRMGMTDQAIAELLAANTRDAPANLLLGDLLLNKGLPGRARECYAPAAKQDSIKEQVDLRLALCDWVEGNYYAAVERLAKLSGGAISPLAGYYRACMLVWLGSYDQAENTLANVPLDGAPDDLRAGIEFLKKQINGFQE